MPPGAFQNDLTKRGPDRAGTDPYHPDLMALAATLRYGLVAGGYLQRVLDQHLPDPVRRIPSGSLDQAEDLAGNTPRRDRVSHEPADIGCDRFGDCCPQPGSVIV
jgi:hypothetical protein